LYDFDANTGWFNEAHNTSPTNSTLVQGITELDYCQPTTVDIVVDGVITEIGLGGAYRSTNDSYYKNRTFKQDVITMLIPTSDVGLALLTSELNEDGAGYEIEINSVNTVGSQTTINITFTPNSDFTTFMENVDDGDRLFYLWVKCGNINHLAFGGQLTCDPPVGGVLPMVDDYGFLDHSKNVDTASGSRTGFESDTEDDVAYFGSFLLEKNEIYDAFTVKVEAFNTTTGDDFTLQESLFSFGGVQISGDGRYLLDEIQTINSELPLTSLKREASLKLEPTLDTPTEYGVKIYYPFLLNWKYWIAQNNASVDFYPTQDKNWEQYDNVGDWIIRVELSLIKDGLAFTHSNQIIDNPYNNDDNIDSVINTFLQPSNTLVNVIPFGSQLIVESKHTNLIGSWSDTTWGMITVEPTESSPRWICSSVVPSDSNPNNPLSPISGSVISIDYPSPNIAVMRCLFDSNKINLTNGVKFTAKIADNKEITEGDKTTAPLDFPKTVDGSTFKTLAP
jgi:hypothetical protein